MDSATLDISNLFDEKGDICVDVTCRRCAYNLRGLRQDGRCPECGTAIGLSTHGDLLRFADPEWVETLSRGVRFILWGIVLIVVFTVITGCIVGTGDFSPLILGVGGFFAGLLRVYGVWLLTSPDPSRIGEDRYVTTRKIVRIGLIAGLLSGLFETAKSLIPVPSMLTTFIIGIPHLLCGLVWVIGFYFLFLFIENLVNRIPEPKLAGMARFMRWAGTIGLALIVIGGGIAAFGLLGPGGTLSALTAGGTTVISPPTSAPTSGSATGTFTVTTGTGTTTMPTTTTMPAPSGGALATVLGAACFLAIGSLVFGILLLILFIRLGGKLREQAEIARQTWAQGGTPTVPPIPPSPDVGP